MKRILIDLNIILDFLNKRSYHKEAAIVLNLCAEHKVGGYICAHEITTLAYFLIKESKSKSKATSTIDSILNLLKIIPTTENILRDALLSQIADYEDAVIEESSIKNDIDVIISRNLDDFKKSRITAMTPEQFLLTLD
jgi:predicted nucleic acid-binding protein